MVDPVSMNMSVSGINAPAATYMGNPAPGGVGALSGSAAANSTDTGKPAEFVSKVAMNQDIPTDAEFISNLNAKAAETMGPGQNLNISA